VVDSSGEASLVLSPALVLVERVGGDSMVVWPLLGALTVMLLFTALLKNSAAALLLEEEEEVVVWGTAGMKAGAEL